MPIPGVRLGTAAHGPFNPSASPGRPWPTARRRAIEITRCGARLQGLAYTATRATVAHLPRVKPKAKKAAPKAGAKVKPLKGGRFEPYRQKRDFEVTSEPTESRAKAGSDFRSRPEVASKSDHCRDPKTIGVHVLADGGRKADCDFTPRVRSNRNALIGFLYASAELLLLIC